MDKRERNTSKQTRMIDLNRLFSFDRFIVNQLFDGSNSNLKRNLTVYPENTSK